MNLASYTIRRFVKSFAAEFTEPKPAAVFDMIETLLPRAGYDDRLKRGRLLEL